MNRKTNQELIDLARMARLQAHAPYSNFKVGAVVECADGRVYTGCNVENSTYSLTICAERVAIFKALSDGAKDFRKVAVIADAYAPVPPCGACRQIIFELCGAETEVVMVSLKGQIEIRTAIELLPAPFDKSFL